MKTVRFLEKFDLLINGDTKTIQNEKREQGGGFMIQ